MSPFPLDGAGVIAGTGADDAGANDDAPTISTTGDENPVGTSTAEDDAISEGYGPSLEEGYS